MIFQPELIDRILDGTKTQTRRPVKVKRVMLGGGDLIELPCFYKPGRTYAVQPGRGKKAVAGIKVLEVRRERWKDITEADARLEGFGSDPRSMTQFAARDQFLAYVRKLYPRSHDIGAECWVISFEVVG